MRGLLALAFVVFLHVPAQSQDDPTLVFCKVIRDQAATWFRAGEIAKTRALKPQLEQCIRHERAALDQALRRFVTDHDTRGRN